MPGTTDRNLRYTSQSSGTGTRVITIGRGPDNDVVLDYPMISWEHARLLGNADGTWLQDRIQTLVLLGQAPLFA